MGLKTSEVSCDGLICGCCCFELPESEQLMRLVENPASHVASFCCLGSGILARPEPLLR